MKIDKEYTLTLNQEELMMMVKMHGNVTDSLQETELFMTRKEIELSTEFHDLIYNLVDKDLITKCD